jgi:small subunit ribosomal protein S21
MKKRKNFRRKPKKELQGLQVEVYDGQVEKAIRILKKKVKESNLFIDLRKKEYYEKPSKLRREKKNLSRLRNQYKVQKEKENY